MSYRLRKLWDKNPKAAAKESCFDVIVVALVILFALSGGLKRFPPFWQILIVIIVAGVLIWGVFNYAKSFEKAKFEDDAKDYKDILQNQQNNNWAKLTEWKLEDNCELRKVRSVDDILTAIHMVMNMEREYLILSPAEPVNACCFMQTYSLLHGYMKVEISLCCKGGKTHIYSREIPADILTNMFTSFYTNGIVPVEVTEWYFEREAKR